MLSAGLPVGLWTFSTELVGASSRFTDPNNTGDGCAIAWKAGAEFTRSGTGCRRPTPQAMKKIIGSIAAYTQVV